MVSAHVVRIPLKTDRVVQGVPICVLSALQQVTVQLASLAQWGQTLVSAHEHQITPKMGQAEYGMTE